MAALLRQRRSPARRPSRARPPVPRLARPTDARRLPGDRRRPLRLLDGRAASPRRSAAVREPPGPGGVRGQGGSLAIMAGNHDDWLCPFYERRAGRTNHRRAARPCRSTACACGWSTAISWAPGGSGRPGWRAARSSRRSAVSPGRSPGRSTGSWTWRNERGLVADEERHLRVYRQYAAHCRGSADLVVIGHVHRPVDEAEASPRLIVLGGWQRRSSYLKIDESGATFTSTATSPHECGRRRAVIGPSRLIITASRSRPRTARPRASNRSLKESLASMKFDHHLHTARHSPDSEIDPLRAGRTRPRDRPGRRGDHRARLSVGAGRAGRAAPAAAAPLRVFSGAEISAREGHFLVYGLPSLDEVPRGHRAGRAAQGRPAPSMPRSSPPIRSAGTSRSTRSSPSTARSSTPSSW